MRKVVTYLVAIALMTGAFTYVTCRASAQGNMPVWTTGDFWEYRGSIGSIGYLVEVVVNYTVIETVSVTVGSTTSQAYHCSASLTESIYGQTVSIDGDAYFRTSDISLIKYSFQQGGMRASLEYDPPSQEFQFPLKDAQRWSSTTTETQDAGMGRTSRTVTYEYIAAGPLSQTVHAGTFNTYNITRQEGTQTTFKHYSDTVGNGVLSDSLLGSLPMTNELWSYKYQVAGSQVLFLILLTVLIVVMVVVTIFAVLVMKCRGRAEMFPPIQQPMPGYGWPSGQQPPHMPPSGQPPANPPGQP